MGREVDNHIQGKEDDHHNAEAVEVRGSLSYHRRSREVDHDWVEDNRGNKEAKGVEGPYIGLGQRRGVDSHIGYDRHDSEGHGTQILAVLLVQSETSFRITKRLQDLLNLCHYIRVSDV